MTAEKAARSPTIDLSQVVIKSPCTMDWDSMEGDQRARFCSSCGKHVYNFAELTQQQAVDLLQATGNRLCGRVFRRPDGTILVADCGDNPGRTVRPFQFTIATLIFLITSSAGLFAVLPIVGKVVGPVVERWFNKPSLTVPLTATVGSIEMGEFDCIYEEPLDQP